jgi:hypothetical protein
MKKNKKSVLKELNKLNKLARIQSKVISRLNNDIFNQLTLIDNIQNDISGLQDALIKFHGLFEILFDIIRISDDRRKGNFRLFKEHIDNQTLDIQIIKSTVLKKNKKNQSQYYEDDTE